MNRNRSANLVLILCGAACLAVLAYGLKYYYSAYYLTGRSPSPLGLVLYFILPAVLAGIFFLSLRFRPQIKANMILLTITAGVCLVLTDLAAGYLTRPQTPLLDEAERLSREGEKAFPRVIPRRVFTLQGDDKYVPGIRDAQGLLQPLGGISGVRTVLCNETGRFVTYQSDSLGFNNPPGAAKMPAEILALGDSFAHGFCVEPERNFVSLIGQGAGPVYNLGIGGNGPLLELAGLKEYGPAFKPETVLWFFFEGNDLNNLEMERLHVLLPRYLEDGFSQELLSNQPRIDAGLIRYLEEAAAAQKPGLARTLGRSLMLRNLRRVLNLGLAGAPAPDKAEPGSGPAEPDWPLFIRVLAEARRTAASWGGRLVLVYLPEEQRFLKTSRPTLEAEKSRVLNAAADLDIPVVDLVPSFIAQPDPLGLFNIPDKPSHYNQAGHELVAREVVRFLKSRQDG